MSTSSSPAKPATVEQAERILGGTAAPTNGADAQAVSGWPLIRSPLPPEALSPLGNEAGYGSGMTAIDKPYIYDRLNQSGLPWSVEAVLFEDQPRSKQFKDKNDQPYQQDGYEVVCTLTLAIDDRRFPGVGGDWSRQWGDARKGAFTDAFGRAAMLAGIGLEVWTDRLTEEQKAHVDALRKNGGGNRPAAEPPGDALAMDSWKHGALCPVCYGTDAKSNKGYPPKVWQNAKAPGGLQCDGKADGEYLNHHPPVDPGDYADADDEYPPDGY